MASRSLLIPLLGTAVVGLAVLCAVILLDDAPVPGIAPTIVEQPAGTLDDAPRMPAPHRQAGGDVAQLDVPQNAAPVIADVVDDEPSPSVRPGDPAELSGRVVDPAGTPLAGVTVTYVPDHQTLEEWGFHELSPWSLRFDPEQLEQLPHAVTSADGRFAIASTLVVKQTASGAWLAGTTTQLAFQHAELAARLFPCAGYRGGERDVGDVVMGPGALIRGLVVDEQGDPIMGARVRQQGLSGASLVAGEPGGFNPGALSSFNRQTTDGDGRFELRLAIKGTVSVRVEADQLLPELLRKLAAVPGTPTDVGFVVLRAGASLAGQVRDELGQPVEGALLWALSREDARSAYNRASPDSLAADLDRVDPEDASVTDGAGRFLLGQLDGQRIDVLVSASGFDAARRSAVELDGRELGIVLTAAATLQLDLQDGSGDPVPAADVTARRLSGNVLMGKQSIELEVTADANTPGRHHVSGLGPATNEIIVKAAGWATTRLEINDASARRQLTRLLTLEAELVLTGQLRDASDQPVTDATLTLTPPQALAATYQPLEAEADDGGTFRFPGLAPGTWTLGLHAAGYAPPELEPVVLEAGRQVQPLDIVLTRAGSLAGRVLAADGSPSKGQRVTARQRLPPGSRERNAPGVSASTDPDGVFLFPGMRPGTYDVSSFPGARADVTITAGEEAHLTLQLRQRPAVQGRVTDVRGIPVAGARVTLQQRNSKPDGEIRWSGRRGEHSAEDGSYLVEAARPGSWWVSASHPEGGFSVRHEVLTDWGTEHDVDLVFGGGTISGRVLEEDSAAPAAELRLDLTQNPDDQPRVSNGTTDAGGRYRFTGLQPGHYAFSIRRGTYLPGELDRIELAAGESIDDHELEVRRGAMIHGSIETVDGVPAVDGTTVAISLPDAEPFQWKGQARTEQGRFAVEGLESGSYRLRVYTSRFALWDIGGNRDAAHLLEVDLSLADGEARRLDLTITEP